MLNRTFMLLILLICSLSSRSSLAQTQTAEPIRAQPLNAPSKTAPTIPYETAALPTDRAQAWQMVLDANNLTGDELAPWYLSPHYKTYDAYGRSKGEGTLEYLWQDRNSWYVSYKEGSTTWTRWKTARGIYAPSGQQDSPGYPTSLLLDQFRTPLREDGAQLEPPPYLVDEAFSSFDLTCFRTLPLITGNTNSMQGALHRFCFTQKRPILRFAQGTYTGYYNKGASFQHRIVAKQINLLDGRDPVFDLFVDTLKSPEPTQATLLQPPADAILIKDTTLILPPDIVNGRVINKVALKYPSDMKARRVQGTVRLAVSISADGHVTITDILHSPAKELTDSAMSAVRQWTYSPYMKDGVPVPFHSTIVVTYTLSP